jgi:PPOX class probable FMN-dependent enzyme
MSLPPWRTPLARALHRNRSLPQSKYVQLATLSPDGLPSNRTIVFRGWLEPGSQLKFVTDRRSRKAQQLLAITTPDCSTEPRSWGEVCWYFSKTREQFRIAGRMYLVTADCPLSDLSQARQEAWEQMSDGGRIQFTWPAPGAERSDYGETFNLTPPDLDRVARDFCLLLLQPMVVDHLQLRGNPQDRDTYHLVNEQWDRRSVNP